MRRIIFVEDDEEDMFLFDKAVNEVDRSAEVQYAVCGDDLFYFLRSSYPDLIFLDLNLPGISGLDCLKEIRKIDHEGIVPVIILSISSDQQSIDACFSAKANYYIIKPVKFEKLVQAISYSLAISWEKNSYPTKERFLLHSDE